KRSHAATHTISLHDAPPIFTALVAAIARHGKAGALLSAREGRGCRRRDTCNAVSAVIRGATNLLHLRANPIRTTLRSRITALTRSEEHTSELPSRQHLVCRL